MCLPLVSPPLFIQALFMSLGTSNWAKDYYTRTAGIGFAFESIEDEQGIKPKKDLRTELLDVFKRDWKSEHCKYLHWHDKTARFPWSRWLFRLFSEHDRQHILLRFLSWKMGKKAYAIFFFKLKIFLHVFSVVQDLFTSGNHVLLVVQGLFTLCNHFFPVVQQVFPNTRFIATHCSEYSSNKLFNVI